MDERQRAIVEEQMLQQTISELRSKMEQNSLEHEDQMKLAAHQSTVEMRQLHNTVAELRERLDRQQVKAEIATEELKRITAVSVSYYRTPARNFENPAAISKRRT